MEGKTAAADGTFSGQGTLFGEDGLRNCGKVFFSRESPSILMAGLGFTEKEVEGMVALAVAG